MLHSLTLSSSFARNSTKAACTSSRGGAGKLELLVGLGLGLGVGRDGAAEGGAEPGGPPTGGGPGVAIGGRFSVCKGVPSGVAWGLTPLDSMLPFGVGMGGPVGGAAVVGPLGVPG